MNAAAGGARGLSWSTLGKGVLLAAVACAAIAITAPGKADAGKYEVYECDEQYAGALDATYYTNSSLYPYPGWISCGTGKTGVSLRNSIGVGVYAIGEWNFYAPTGTRMELVNHKYHLYSAQGHTAAIALTASNGTLLAYWTASAPGDSYLAGSTEPTAGSVLSVQLYCPNWCGNQNNSVHSYVKNIHFRMIDVVAPAVDGLSGSLTAGGPHHGVEGLTVVASDTGGGIAGGTVTVNGTDVERLSASCATDPYGRAVRMQVCSTSSTSSFSFNTEEPPWQEGQNTVRVCASDYTNNGSAPAVDCEEFTVTIDNTCPKSAGTSQATHVSAGLDNGSGESKQRLTVRSTQGATVRGTLTNSGSPIGGATVCLYERIQREGESRRLIDTTYTRPSGTYSMSIHPGPSRTFDVVSRFNNKVVESRQLVVDSAVLPDFTVKPRKGLTNGESARFRGAIPGPHAAQRGVSLQARAGKKWRTFKQLKTNDQGRFRGQYPFRHTIGHVRYTFRALVKQQNGYPFLGGASKKKKVLVSG